MCKINLVGENELARLQTERADVAETSIHYYIHYILHNILKAQLKCVISDRPMFNDLVEDLQDL